MLCITFMFSCIVCIWSCISFWRSAGSLVAWIFSICCCIFFMFSRIWGICLSMSMLIAGLVGGAFSCADTIGADRAQAMNAVIRTEDFILIFPIGLHTFLSPLLLSTG